MGKNKLFKFSEIRVFENVIQHNQHSETIGNNEMKGKWHSDFFKNNNPIVLEIGCGKGEYSVGLAERYPDKNFLGLDLKGNRIYIGAKHALDTGLKNVGFVRTRIENIDTLFDAGEVDEIWITFPDPQPGLTGIRKRLTSKRFLKLYKQIIKPNGIINLKTDSQLLYEYTLEVIAEENLNLIYNTNNLYATTDEWLTEMKQIKTYYEKMFYAKGFDINFLVFNLGS